jgi:MFS family permease
MRPDRRLLSLQAIFALNALGIATWLPRIPDVKQALGLDVLTLAFCLFGLPAGTMLGFLVVGRITRTLGLKRTVLVAGPGFLLTMILPGLATSAPGLFAALFVAGFVVALIEVAMNAKASQLEHASGRRLMTRCHAFWSFGTMIGAPLGGAFAQAGLALLPQQLILQPIFALGTIWATRFLLPDETAPQEPESRRAWPTAALLALCLLPIGALLIEGAMMEWSALYLRQDRAASPFAAGLALSVFALAMACARLAGDRVAEAAGPHPVLVISGLLMGAGMLGFALAPSVALSLPFAAMAGLGTGNIYPLALSLAAPLPGRRPEENVATLALIGFTAFLIAPPLIGGLASVVGLGAALALLSPLGLVPLAMLARRPRPARGQPQ